MLQVRAEPAESMIKKFRRNTCNGERHLAFCLNRDPPAEACGGQVWGD